MVNSKLLFELEELYDRHVKLLEDTYINYLEAENNLKVAHMKLKDLEEILDTTEDMIKVLGGDIRNFRLKRNNS